MWGEMLCSDKMEGTGWIPAWGPGPDSQIVCGQVASVISMGELVLLLRGERDRGCNIAVGWVFSSVCAV
jgi:hypothetical protein